MATWSCIKLIDTEAIHARQDRLPNARQAVLETVTVQAITTTINPFNLLKVAPMKTSRTLPILLATLATIASAPLQAAEADGRQRVEMPVEARAELRAEMLDFQAAVHSIVGALAEQQFAKAADIAEKQIGVSAMGRHRNAPAGARPGVFMPNDMHAIARSMHTAASDFAKVARNGDTTKALASLQAVTGACVACHHGYRTQ